MDMKRTYKFSLRRKLVIFTTILAIVTYSTSAFFLYFLSEFFEGVMSEQLFTILTLGAGIFWSGVLAYFAARFITKPLMQLEQIAIKVANGHINEDVPLSKSDDEIRSLGIAFNKMLNSIRVMVRNIEDNFAKTNSKVIEIGKASSMATTQTESIAQTIAEISAGADGSANAVQTTAQSMEDIQKVAITVQDKAKNSEKLSNEMAMKLNESCKKLQSLISGIQQLANSNETSFQAVHRLKKHAQEIEHISSLVGDIAGQTNLLALNASIEAARAGEHGKGFAVVAEEVRKLADECAQAVQGINNLIQNIQTEVKAVVTLISTQKEVTNKEVANAAETNEAIMTMATSSNEVVNAVKDISALVDKQMKIVESTVIQSQEVAAIAEQTSAGAQEVAASTKQQINVMANIEALSNDLASEAQKLNQTIQKFVYNKNDN